MSLPTSNILTYADLVKPHAEADTLLAAITINEARLGRPLTADERAEVLRLIREPD